MLVWSRMLGPGPPCASLLLLHPWAAVGDRGGSHGHHASRLLPQHAGRLAGWDPGDVWRAQDQREGRRGRATENPLKALYAIGRKPIKSIQGSRRRQWSRKSPLQEETWSRSGTLRVETRFLLCLSILMVVHFSHSATEMTWNRKVVLYWFHIGKLHCYSTTNQWRKMRWSPRFNKHKKLRETFNWIYEQQKQVKMCKTHEVMNKQCLINLNNIYYWVQNVICFTVGAELHVNLLGLLLHSNWLLSAGPANRTFNKTKVLKRWGALVYFPLLRP